MTREEIINASKADGGMFIVIPSVVKLDRALPLSAQMLYGIITWKCNSRAYTWATNREFGEALGVSPKRASVLLSMLEERGHVETEIEYREGTNQVVRRYVYPIMKSARPAGEDSPRPENGDTSPRERGDASPDSGGALPENGEVKCNKIKENKDSIKRAPKSPPEGDAPPKKAKRGSAGPKHFPEGFARFWADYPRKDGKQAAVKAWDKLQPDAELCRVMYAALSRAVRSPEWGEDGGRFIPYFSTWLNQRRWENEGVDLSLLPQPQRPGGWAPDPEVK